MPSRRLTAEPNRMDRRSLLSLGCFGLTSFNFLSSLQVNVGKPRAARATSVLLLYMDGGPSHIDMFDLKPHAPAEIRGPVRPIDSSVPGVSVFDSLGIDPQQAVPSRDNQHQLSTGHPLAELFS